MKINEFTVTLGSYQDVMDVLYATKNRYDEENEFQINIVSDADRELNVYTVQISKQELSPLPKPDPSSGMPTSIQPQAATTD